MTTLPHILENLRTSAEDLVEYTSPCESRTMRPLDEAHEHVIAAIEELKQAIAEEKEFAAT